MFVVTPAPVAGQFGEPPNNYSGKIIKVIPGGIFVLWTRLVYDQPGVNGYYNITIIWEDNNRADENFTVLYTRAFMDNDGDNLPGPSPIWLENATYLVSGPGTNGIRWTFSIHNTTGDPNDGYFNVEIYMQAASRGINHILTDNHPINKPGWGASIEWVETPPYYFDPRVGTIKVGTLGVDVAISPEENEAAAGETVTFTVTVRNTGNVQGNYALENTDSLGWPLALDDNILTIPAGENRVTTLTVTIPENATPCTEDNVTVTATSVENAEVRDNDSCIAHVSIWTGAATFGLENLYAVRLEKDLWLYLGSKLVVKFYKYDNTYENEVVIDNFTPPWHVEENENVPHPTRPWCIKSAVKKAKLLLVDNLGNEISKIKGWVTIRNDIWAELLKERRWWIYATPAERDAIWKELRDKRALWPSAPSTRDPGWVDP